MVRRSPFRPIGVLLGGAALGLASWWLVAGPGGAPAQAQIPDSGAQLQQIIVELQQLNKQVAELRDLARKLKDERTAEPKQPAAKTPR